MTNTNLLWHYRVHRKFQESLMYIQLSFLPVYRRKDIFDRLTKFLGEKEILSYCIYEVYGYYDILLRLWLPNSESPLHFRKRLHESLEDLGCTRAIPFYVEENPLHWAWTKSTPTTRDIENLSETLIESINNEDFSDLSILEDLEQKHIVRKYNPDNGIKFFVVITPPNLSEAPSQQSTKHFVDSLKQFFSKSKNLVEPSIYFGSGFAWVLVKGKLKFNNYTVLNDFVQEINERGVMHYHARTYTYLVTGSKDPYCIEKEGFISTTSTRRSEENIEHYLKHEEDDRFEVKGSLLINIDRYLRDEKVTDEVLRDVNIAHKGVIRSIVGLLNTAGGKILIGAIEAPKYTDILDKPNNKLEKFPHIGDRIVIGIDQEIDYKTKGWEGYCRKLTDLVRAQIGRDVSVMIKLKEYQFDDRILCIIDVPKGSEWHYLNKKEFWVRRANSTIMLEGHEMDSYKNLHPGIDSKKA